MKLYHKIIIIILCLMSLIGFSFIVNSQIGMIAIGAIYGTFLGIIFSKNE